MQKAVLGATFAIAIGAGLHQARRASQLSEQLRALQLQEVTLEGQSDQTARERDSALADLAALREQNQAPRIEPARAAQLRPGDPGDPTEVAVQSWLKRISSLKQRFKDAPEANIPELQFLKDLDWVEVAADNKLENETDYRRALAEIRKRAASYFVEQLHGALGKYIQANNGQWPSDISQLESYFDPPVERALWQRWEIVPTTAFPGREFASGWVITEKSAADPEFDSRHTIDSPSSGGVGPYRPYGFQEKPSDAEVERQALKATLEPVLNAYKLANGGQEPGNASALEPYVSNDSQQAALQRIIEMLKQPRIEEKYNGSFRSRTVTAGDDSSIGSGH